MLKKGPNIAKARMNACGIVSAPPFGMKNSQGYGQINLPDQHGGSIVAGEIRQQPPGGRVISYPINNTHLVYRQPVTRTIVQSPASSFSTIHGSVLNLQQDVQATEVSLGQLNGAQFVLPEGHSILLPSSCGTKFIQASVIAHQPDSTLIASTQEQSTKRGSVKVKKQGYVHSHDLNNLGACSTTPSTSTMKLQGNSTTGPTSRIKLQDKSTTPSTSTINLPTSADHSIGDFISQNEMGGFSNVLVTLDKSGNIIQCQPLSCEDGHLTSSEIVKVQKKNSTEQTPVGGYSNDDKLTQSVVGEVINLEGVGKELSSPDYTDDMTQSVGADLTNFEAIGKELTSPDYVHDVSCKIESTSNEDKNAPSVLVDSNRLEENREEHSSKDYDDHYHVMDTNQSTENTIITSPENEEHRISPSSSDVTIQGGKKNTNFTNGCENVTLKTTLNEDKMVKAVVRENDDVSRNVTNFQTTLDKLREKLNARSKKENSNQEVVVDKEQTKNELFGKEYKVLDEDVSELETTDHEIIGDYKFRADDEYEITQDEDKEIDHEEVVETTRSTNKENIGKRRHQDNLFEIFANETSSDRTMKNEEKDRSENGKGQTQNLGILVQDVAITKDKNNSKDSLMTNDMNITKDVQLTTDTKITNDLERTKDMNNHKDGVITEEMTNAKDDIVRNDTKFSRDVQVRKDMKINKNVQVTSDTKITKDFQKTKDMNKEGVMTQDMKNAKEGVMKQDMKNAKEGVMTQDMKNAKEGVMTQDMKNAKEGVMRQDMKNAKEGVMTQDMKNAKEGVMTQDMKNAKEGVMTQDMKNAKEGVMPQDMKNAKEGVITQEMKNPNDSLMTQDTKIDSKKDELDSEIKEKTCENDKKEVYEEITAGNMKKTDQSSPLQKTFVSNEQELEREVNSNANSNPNHGSDKSSKSKSAKRRKEEEQEDEEVAKSTPNKKSRRSKGVPKKLEEKLPETHSNEDSGTDKENEGQVKDRNKRNVLKEVQKKNETKKDIEDVTNIPRMTLRGNRHRNNISSRQNSKENVTTNKSTAKGKSYRKDVKTQQDNIRQKNQKNKKKSLTKAEINSTKSNLDPNIPIKSQNEEEENKKSKRNSSTREDQKVKAVGMKDSGLKLLAEAAVLHPIDNEVEQIQQTQDCTPNVNLKIGIDNAPKKRVLQLWKCQPEIEQMEIHDKETEGKMMVKLSNGESTKVTVGNLQECTDVTDNGTKMDVREPVAMASTLIETVSLINEATRSTISPNDDDTMGKNDPTQNVQQSLSQFPIKDIGLRINDNYSDTVIKKNQYEVVNTSNNQSDISTWRKSSTSMITGDTNQENHSMLDRNLMEGSQQLSTAHSTNNQQFCNWNNPSAAHLVTDTNEVMDRDLNIGSQFNQVQYTSQPSHQRTNSMMDTNFIVGSQQFNTINSSNQGNEQENGRNSTPSSLFNNNSWSNYGQNWNSNDFQPMYQTSNGTTPTNRWNGRWTHQEYVQNSGHQDTTTGLNSITQTNQFTPNYSMGNYYQQDNLRMSGSSGNPDGEMNGDMYYSSISHNHRRMPSFQPTGLHCNCCSRFVRERQGPNEFTTPHQTSGYWNRSRNMQSPPEVSNSFHMTANDWNSNGSVASQQFPGFNYNCHPSNNEWNMNNLMQTPPHMNYRSQMSMNNWNSNGIGFSRTPIQCDYNSHMTNNIWNRNSPDTFTFPSGFNNPHTIRNMMPDRNSTTNIQYTSPSNGNQHGIIFPTQGRIDTEPVFQNSLHRNNVQSTSTSTRQPLSLIVENKTPAHSNQSQLSVSESPLDLRTNREPEISPTNVNCSKPTKKSTTGTKRPYRRRNTTIPKGTKAASKKTLKERQDNAKKTSPKAINKSNKEVFTDINPLEGQIQLDMSHLEAETKKKCEDVDNSQILLTKELLTSKNVETSIQLQEVIAEEKNEQNNSNKTAQEKEDDNSNPNNGHTKETRTKEKCKGQESNEEIHVEEKNNCNENKSISKDRETFQRGKMSVHPPANGNETTPVPLKPKTKADDATETATEGDDGEVPDDYYDRCQNTDVEITPTNSQGI